MSLNKKLCYTAGQIRFFPVKTVSISLRNSKKGRVECDITVLNLALQKCMSSVIRHSDIIRQTPSILYMLGDHFSHGFCRFKNTLDIVTRSSATSIEHIW